jgi:outer membrane immunogenic protein
MSGGLDAVGLSARVSALSISLSFLSLFTSAEAIASDLYGPPGLKDDPPPFVLALWQGSYLGGHIGGVWNNIDIADTYTYFGDPTARNSTQGSGPIGGLQAGYNFQSLNLVYGLEADIGSLNLSGRKTVGLQTDPHNEHTG